nr:hypothetical protein [Calditrichia bacterium]
MRRITALLFFVLLLLNSLFVFAETEAQADARQQNTSRHSVERAPMSVSKAKGPVYQVPATNPLAVGGVAYGQNAQTDAWLRISTLNPSGATTLGNTGAGSYYGGDFDDSGLFAAVDNDLDRLVVIDTASGLITAVGTAGIVTGDTWTGLTYDATDGTWYASSTNGVTSNFYTVNPATGAATLVGNNAALALVIDISASPTGEIWAHDIGLDAIYVMDKSTWAETLVGSTGFDANFAQGMDFDATSGELYLAAYNNTVSQGELRLVDQATGAAALVGTLGAGTGVEVGAFGFPGSAADDADPNPVTSAGAYSDYTTPSSISLTWDDPTTYFNGDPLPASDFTVEISRDGAALASVAGGVGAYDDNSVSDGTFYEYTLVVKVTATDSMSTEASTGWTAGGSPIPSVPMSLAITDPGTGQLQANWTNPSTNIDGTPMDDFAAINLYENGTLLATFTRATTDTGTADSDLFTPAAGTNLYRITAVDNEGAGNESAQSNAAYSPIGLPFQDEF